MSKTHYEEEDLEEPEVLASKGDFSDFFQGFEGNRKEILQKVIEASKNSTISAELPKLEQDESFYEYMNKHREDIESNDQVKHYLYQELGKIEKEEAVVIRLLMQEHGEQKLSFDSPDNTIQIQGSCDLKYKVENKLKIIEPKNQISQEEAPLCLSLPLQDANGRNMKLKNAKYLFINYDDSGKISHISHPEPIAFEGNKCYCMVEDQRFYLKIEQQQLDALKQQIFENRGGELEAQDMASKRRAEEIRKSLSEEKGASGEMGKDDAAAVMSSMESDKKYGPALPDGWVVNKSGNSVPPPPSSPPPKPYTDTRPLTDKKIAELPEASKVRMQTLDLKRIFARAKELDTENDERNDPLLQPKNTRQAHNELQNKDKRAR